MIRSEITELITKQRARVGVIGLGYVGLPLAVEFARSGFIATGFEVDESKAAEINHGRSYIGDVSSEAVAELIAGEKLSATTDFSRLASCDIIIICVPTPLRKTKEPDISYILAAAEEIKRSLRRGQLVVLESTTYPGTTDEVLLPMFEETGLKLDEDFLLAFSPERVDPGNPQFQTHNIPKVVGGVTEDSTEVAAHLYGQIVRDVHAVSSARVAEAAKLLENTFRAVNIGMANEMARLCYALGIDTWEVIRAAATKPFGFMPFYPGPGIGGHCLVGDETIIVRPESSASESLRPIASIFAEQESGASANVLKIDGVDVITNPKLQALSLNTETQLPQWKPVTHLFRRRFKGSVVTVTTSDNRRLTVTDEHPMLVCDEAGKLQKISAQDLRVGARIPIHHLPPPVMGGLLNNIASPLIDLLPLLPAELISKIRVRISGGSWHAYTGAHSYQKNVRSYTHRNASAAVGFFSSSPQMFQQVVYLLQGLGFTPTFKRTKPHLQMNGRQQLLRMRGWLGAKGERLERYFRESRRDPASKTFKQFGALTTVPIKSVEIETVARPIDVYSIEVEDNHTFATSYGIYVHNCIPLDPHYLSWKARQHGFDSRFIGLAEEVNSRMPEHVLRLVADGLNDARKALNGSRVLLVGVAYKKDINDVRESPALSIIDLLRAKGADVRYHDPFVSEVRFDDAHTMGEAEPLQSVELNDEELRGADCVVIVTDHSEIDYARVTALAPLIVDTRNALGGELRRNSKARIIRL